MKRKQDEDQKPPCLFIKFNGHLSAVYMENTFESSFDILKSQNAVNISI